MKRKLGKFLLFISGWKWDKRVEIPQKCIIVCAPHTSNWDFYYGIIAFWAINVPFKVFIKDSYTKSWYGKIIKSLGGLGVNRSSANDMVHKAIFLLQENTEIAFLITPEGTRGRVDNWKRGFYIIAKKTGLPIVLAIPNYRDKKCLIPLVIENVSARSYEEVCMIIEEFVISDYAKYPKNYNERISGKNIKIKPCLIIEMGFSFIKKPTFL